MFENLEGQKKKKLTQAKTKAAAVAPVAEQGVKEGAAAAPGAEPDEDPWKAQGAAAADEVGEHARIV